MKTTIEGTVYSVQTKTGEKNGKGWKKITVVIQTAAKYNNTVPVEFFNQEFNVKEGDKVKADVFIGGREWEGRFFSTIDGDRLEVIGQSSQQQTTPPQAPEVEAEDDGLPF